MKARILIFTVFMQSWAMSVFFQNSINRVEFMQEDILPFAPVGAEWHYSYAFGCCPENHFNHIISEKDTIVEGNSCRVLRQYYDNLTVASETYIVKQEQGKVYYYYQDQFNLLFDFDAEVNDIIE
ncbi:MAG: hypothetical protein LBD45_07215, partial [Bacteroidales bacterium]|nr:hypothetical protein [Bacteroidales bacterium]